MLLQSHEGVVAPLAALPNTWRAGSYRGLLARGAFEVSANWSNGHADRFTILSRTGGVLKLRYPGVARATVRATGGERVNLRRDGDDDIAFETPPGATYVVAAIPIVE